MSTISSGLVVLTKIAASVFIRVYSVILIFEKAGAKMVGYVPIEGYTFAKSRCLIPHLNEITAPEDGEKFCGLPVDEDSEGELTEERVKNWCAQLKSEMGI